MSVAIRIENVSKLYRLGTVGTGTISHDLNRWWHQIRGKDDPYAKVGQVNDRTQPATKNQEQSNKNGAAPDYVWALRDINLEVEQGEILGIIGRNGAGKSTLLKILSRVTAPTEGQIRTKGSIASLLEVGTGFHPELTGRENIYLNGAILGMKRREVTSQLDAIVEFSGCGKYIDTPTKRYSSGMTVRLGFAVAAHLACEILVVDEVLAVGDAEFQERCIGKMKSVAGDGRTVLFVSHNLGAVRALCSSAICVDQGQLQFSGSCADVLDGYIASNAKYGEVELEARSDSGGELISSASISTVASQNANRLLVGEPFEVFIALSRSIECNPFIVIRDELGRPIVSSFLQDSADGATRVANSFAVRVASLDFRPGNYTLDVGILGASNEILDWLQHAMRFQVEPFHEDRRPFDGRVGILSLPFEWSASR